MSGARHGALAHWAMAALRVSLLPCSMTTVGCAATSTSRTASRPHWNAHWVFRKCTTINNHGKTSSRYLSVVDHTLRILTQYLQHTDAVHKKYMAPRTVNPPPSLSLSHTHTHTNTQVCLKGGKGRVSIPDLAAVRLRPPCSPHYYGNPINNGSRVACREPPATIPLQLTYIMWNTVVSLGLPLNMTHDLMRRPAGRPFQSLLRGITE